MKRSVTAIALTLTLAFLPSPARSNPAALAIPACSAFMPGCVVLGTVAIAGSLYWVYQDAKGLWVAPIIDPENPEGWELGEEMAVTASNPQKALELCREAARRNGKKLKNIRRQGQFNGANTYVCTFS